MEGAEEGPSVFVVEKRHPPLTESLEAKTSWTATHTPLGSFAQVAGWTGAGCVTKLCWQQKLSMFSQEAAVGSIKHSEATTDGSTKRFS